MQIIYSIGEAVIKRDKYLKQLIDKQNNGLIKVITGFRRVGKSYLLFNIYYD
jgi:predicted AAA+ superfamily ATPase